jgi:hypothetical protein
MSGILTYAQTTGSLSTSSSTWTPIPGLAIKLPRAVERSALVILNIPNPYARGEDFPGGDFGLQVDGTLLGPYASFTYSEQRPASFGRMPTTLSVVVPLSGDHEVAVVAVWSGIRGSTVNLDSPATLTGLLG